MHGLAQFSHLGGADRPHAAHRFTPDQIGRKGVVGKAVLLLAKVRQPPRFQRPHGIGIGHALLVAALMRRIVGDANRCGKRD